MDLMNPQRLLWSTAAAAAVQLIGMRCSLLMPMAQIVSVPTVDGYGDNIMTCWTYGAVGLVAMAVACGAFWRETKDIWGARARHVRHIIDRQPLTLTLTLTW